jgi:UDP-N-acetylmuramate--alanine ligase
MNKHYHLIGIGGIGMSGIAQLLLRSSITVSGSDLKDSKITQDLKRQGAQVFIGHNPENIKGADLIIYSSAIKEGNPEIIEAKRQGIPLIKRAQALADLMKDKAVITVTGSHGKTTTASLISYLLLEAGLFPTVAIGGILRNIDTNASLGEGEFFVAEADESDGSFLYYQPKYSVITNIDREHLDYYKEFKNEIETFREFVNKTKKDGCVFCCGDDANLKNILSDYKNRYLLFGLEASSHIYPKNIQLEGLMSEFDCFYRNKFIDRFRLALGGRHNISNALSVIALGLELGIGLESIKKALENYKGAKRRLEIKFSDRDLLVIDDYAHHPTEIRATLEATANLKRQRVVAIFQPHRYTRTQILLDEFSKSFDLADYIIITDIYPASEIPIEGISALSLVEKIKKYSSAKVVVFMPKEEIASHILGMINPGDLVITLGAGDIVKVNDELVERLKGQGKI